jgi:uncharacterized protein YggE
MSPGTRSNRVSGIAFELSDPEGAYHEALQEAIERARREAEVAAGALGEALGPPIQVSTGGFSVPRPEYGYRMAAAGPQPEMAAPPVEAGELEVQASVSITYRLGS